MANYKKEPNFWEMSDMIDYVQKKYPDIRMFLESENNRYPEKESAKATIRKKIRDTFDIYKVGHKEAIGPHGRFFIAEKFGKLIIDDILKTFFVEAFPLEIKKIKEEFAQRDMQLSCIEEDSMPLVTTDERDPDYDKIKEAVEKRTVENNPDMYDENGIAKSYYEYHIRGIELSSDEIDTIVDRTMLRAIFDHLFEFNEYEFRKAFAEREGLVDLHPPVEYSEGYSELTYKLENPLGHYIFPRKETSAQNRKSTKKETSTQNQKSTKKESEK